MTAPARFRFVHLTDTHVMAGGGWRFGSGDAEFDTAGSLRRVVQAVRGLDPAPDFAVLGGDLASPDLLDRTVVLTSVEYEPSYRLLQEILAELPCPLHVLPGNHDDRGAFNRVLLGGVLAPGAPHCWSFDHGGTTSSGSTPWSRAAPTATSMTASSRGWTGTSNGMAGSRRSSSCIITRGRWVWLGSTACGSGTARS